MNLLNSRAAAIGLLAASLGCGGVQAHAEVITLTFEGAGNQAALNGFYNGGTDSMGRSGTNYGIQFGGNTLSIIDKDAGGSGNFANEPTPDTIMFFLTGSAVLNYAAGFTDGFSFYYTSLRTARVNVYDGLDATGNILGFIDLSAQYNANNCLGDPHGGNGDTLNAFCNWSIGSVAFSGLARSIDFAGSVNQTGYDNITFGSTNPASQVSSVPEPASLALMLSSLGVMGVATRRRRPA